ncbi:MAG: NUDIX domain-containing protein [bacterium]|nr:NUDIX domain-containing protein [bacterium]
MKPAKILFCGSFKFLDEMKRVANELKLFGCQCFLPRFFLGDFSSLEIEKIKNDLKEKGLKRNEFKKIIKVTGWFYEKLRQADILVIFDKEGYVGLSLSAEIGAAQIMGKPTFFIAEPKDAGLRAMLRFSKNFKIVPPEVLIEELETLKQWAWVKKCDHTSVGMHIWRNGKLLLIERKKPPFGFAPPAGHVDGSISFEEAAKRELQEEVGLRAKKLKLIFEGRKQNPCRRKGGAWHYWKVYNVEAEGQIKRSVYETKNIGWYSSKQIENLAEKTRRYLAGQIPEREWVKSPGLEVFWYRWRKELKIF